MSDFVASGMTCPTCARLAAERDALVAEAAQLRRALEDIAENSCRSDTDFAAPMCDHAWARAALGQFLESGVSRDVWGMTCPTCARHTHESEGDMKLKSGKTWMGPTVGASVFIRTVTYHYTGRVVGIDRDWIHLADAAWIADSGRWAAALASGTLSEVEPYPGAGAVSIARGAIVDVCPWGHALPREVR